MLLFICAFGDVLKWWTQSNCCCNSADGQPLLLQDIENDITANAAQQLTRSKWTFITQEVFPCTFPYAFPACKMMHKFLRICMFYFRIFIQDNVATFLFMLLCFHEMVTSSMFLELIWWCSHLPWITCCAVSKFMFSFISK